MRALAAAALLALLAGCVNVEVGGVFRIHLWIANDTPEEAQVLVFITPDDTGADQANVTLPPAPARLGPFNFSTPTNLVSMHGFVAADGRTGKADYELSADTYVVAHLQAQGVAFERRPGPP